MCTCLYQHGLSDLVSQPSTISSPRKFDARNYKKVVNFPNISKTICIYKIQQCNVYNITCNHQLRIAILTISTHQPRVKARCFSSAVKGLFPYNCDSVDTTISPVVISSKHDIISFDLATKSIQLPQFCISVSVSGH